MATQAQATEALAHATTAMANIHDALGAVQDAMAAPVDAHLQAMQAATRGIKQSLSRKGTAAVNFQGKITGSVVAPMGQTIGTAAAQQQQGQQALAAAAVGLPAPAMNAPASSGSGTGSGTPATSSPPTAPTFQPSGVFQIYYICHGTNAQLVAADMMDPQYNNFAGQPPTIWKLYSNSNVPLTFATQSDALTAIQFITTNGLAPCGASAPPPTTTAAPVPPPAIPPTTQPTTNATVTIGCDSDGNLQYTWTGNTSASGPLWLYLFPPGPAQPPANIIATVNVDTSGPFSDDPTAWVQTYVQQQGITCSSAPPPPVTTAPAPPAPPPTVYTPAPAPSCPPPPTCPAVPTPTPETPPAPIACGSGQVPNLLTIGSADFCAALPDLIQGFSTLGGWAISLVSAATDISAFTATGGLSLLSDQGLLPSVSDIISGLWGLVSDWFSDKTKDAVNQLKQVVQCWWGAMQTSQGCNMTVVLQLCVARGIIDLLQRVRLGWDVAIWGTVDVTIHIDPLIKVLDYLIAYSCPAEVPGTGETVEAYIRGRITIGQFECWMKLRGADPEVWRPIVMSRMELLPEKEFIQWGRRTGLPDHDIQEHLRRYGYLSHEERARRMLVYDELPTVSDHLHWLQRNVFDDAYVQQYNLLDGFLDRFWAKFGTALLAQGYTQDRASLEYAAHWVIPPTGQLAEMMFRLRPGRVDPSIQFTEQDFANLLAEQDIAPFYRERLKYVSFRTMPLRQLNQSVQQGRFDRAELVERFKDIGYRQADAETLADTYTAQATRQAAAAGHGYTAALVSEMLQYKQITSAQAAAYLAPQGFTEAQIADMVKAAADQDTLRRAKKHDEGTLSEYATLALKNYEDGVIDNATAKAALSAAGYTDMAANLATLTVDARVQKATVDLGIKTVQRALRYGAVDGPGAVAALLQVGVVPPMAQTYVSRWLLARSVPNVAASSAAILRWTRKGIMSVANAAVRLKNLGWADGDIQLQLAEVENAALQAQTLAKQKSAAALVKAQKAAQQAIKASQASLCKIYTPSKMVKWYALRIINADTFKQRLSTCGYTDEAITGLFEEATVALAAADAKAAKSGQTGIQYAGPGSVPTPAT